MVISTLLGTLALIVSFYHLLTHFSTFAQRDSPDFQRTRRGFAVVLLLDTLSYACVFGYSFLVETAPWYRWVFLTGLLMHVSYIFAFLNDRIYRRFHRYEHVDIFSDGQFVLLKRTFLGFDLLFHGCAVAYLLPRLSSQAGIAGFIIAGSAYALIWGRRTTRRVPADAGSSH